MRMTSMFGGTLRQAPAEAETISHQLLLRAAAIRQLGAGIYSFLPLGWRVIRKIEQIMREEMDAIDGQELRLPALHPADVWKESGRWEDFGPAMLRLKDRSERDLALGPTHEEIVTDLARHEVRSYRQLPFMVYQMQTKFRDEPRPRGGLIRLREFIMKDAYSFHPDHESLDAYYPRMYEAYVHIFRRAGLRAIPVEADSGMMGGSGSHEFMLISASGEDTVMFCKTCGYAANLERAEFRKPAPALSASAAPPEPIAQLSDFLSMPAGAMLKTIIYASGNELIAAVVPGDLEVNEAKFASATRIANFHLASEEELLQAGIEPGFVSPVGKNLRVIVDDSISKTAEYVAGGNKKDTHLLHVQPGRDFTATQVADLTSARVGDPCPRCGEGLHSERGIEAGHTFKLGTKYSAAMGATYLAADGKEYPLVMGSYGIGADRLMASLVEQHHDERGIIWPKSVAPFDAHLVILGAENEAVSAYGDAVYKELTDAGLSVIYDDRVETPGVKFNDADLMGMPVRLTVSPRNIKQDVVELKPRSGTEASLCPRGELQQNVRAMLAALP